MHAIDTTYLNDTLTAIAAEYDLDDGCLVAEACDDNVSVNIVLDEAYVGYAVLHHAADLAAAERWVASRSDEYWYSCR